MNIDILAPKASNISTQKQVQEPTILSKEDMNFNKNITQNETLYGTYYKRPQQDGEAGIKDEKFRIVDKREMQNNIDDRRKMVTGMVCTSYSKGDLIKLAEFLKIDEDLKKLDKIQLCKLIEDYFDSTNLMLK
jgi:hypothetical protein